MSPTPRPPPRFLPTLTEVVHPASLTTDRPTPRPDPQALAQLVMSRVDALLMTRVQEELERLMKPLVEETVCSLSLQLQHEMQIRLNKAIVEVLAEHETKNKR